MLDESPVVPPLQMGDMDVKDVGDLGVDFFNRMSRDKHGEMEKLAFVNDMGADSLAQWLVDRAIKRRQRGQYPAKRVEIQQEMRQAASSVQRQAGFGERDFTPVGQTKGLVDRSIESYYEPTDVMEGVPDGNPDHALPKAKGKSTPRRGLSSEKVAAKPKSKMKLKPKSKRASDSEVGFGEDSSGADLNVVFGSGPTPLSVDRHDEVIPAFRDDPIGVVGRSEKGLRSATDLPGSMKAKMDLGIKDEWDNGDYSDDLDLNNFDFADPATDSPFR